MDKILLVRVGALGDTLMVTPAIRALRRLHPEAELDFLCSEYAAPVLELNPNLSILYRLRWRNVPYALSYEKHRLVRRLRSRNHDTAILLETAPRYRRILELAHIRRIGGFAAMNFNPENHCILNYLNAVGCQYPDAEDLQMDLPVAPADQAVAERLIGDLDRPRIGIHFGYGPRGKKRHQGDRLRGWSRDNFFQLIRMLLNRTGSIVLTGSVEDWADTEFIFRQLPPGRVRSVVGQTQIRELAAILKNLDLFISVDTGPAHMAAAVGVPMVVLWGPTIFEQTRPISPSTPIKILRVSVPCAPCYGTPLKDSCTRNICMEKISPAAVLEAAQGLLDSAKSIP